MKMIELASKNVARSTADGRLFGCSVDQMNAHVKGITHASELRLNCEQDEK